MVQHLYSRAIASPSCAQSCAVEFTLNRCKWLLPLLWLNLSGQHLQQNARLTGPRFAQEAMDKWQAELQTIDGQRIVDGASMP